VYVSLFSASQTTPKSRFIHFNIDFFPLTNMHRNASFVMKREEKGEQERDRKLYQVQPGVNK